MRPWVRVLGIDPGSRITGYGILDTNGQQSRHVASGAIRAIAGGTFVERLAIIFNEVNALVREYQPVEVAVERVFLARNPDSALKLGQARAAAICGTLEFELPMFEYAAREVKLAIVGKGSAGKEQVQHMVRVLLSLDKVLQMDESDALGIALCHAHTRNMSQRYAEAMS